MKKRTAVDLIMLAFFVALAVYILAGIASVNTELEKRLGDHAAAGSSGDSLKVKVKLKYSDWIREHGMGKAYFHYYDESGDVSKTKDLSKNFPKEVTLQFPSGSVDVNEKFTVILNSYVCDDASDVQGVNHPTKSPETVRMKFPC